MEKKQVKQAVELLTNLTVGGEVTWKERVNMFSSHGEAWFDCTKYKDFTVTVHIRSDKNNEKSGYSLWGQIEKQGSESETWITSEKYSLPLIHEILKQTNINRLDPKPNAGDEFTELYSTVEYRETVLTKLLQPTPWHHFITKFFKK